MAGRRVRGRIASHGRDRPAQRDLVRGHLDRPERRLERSDVISLEVFGHHRWAFPDGCKALFDADLELLLRQLGVTKDTTDAADAKDAADATDGTDATDATDATEGRA